MDKKPSISELKNFIFILSGILLVFSLYPLLKSGSIRYWILFFIPLLLTTAIWKPQWIKPIYLKWIAIGEVIGNIISKI
jgi:hypothetical protein